MTAVLLVLAHGASGPFDELIKVVFVVGLVFGYSRIARALRESEDDTNSLVDQKLERQ